MSNYTTTTFRRSSHINSAPVSPESAWDTDTEPSTSYGFEAVSPLSKHSAELRQDNACSGRPDSGYASSMTEKPLMHCRLSGPGDHHAPFGDFHLTPPALPHADRDPSQLQSMPTPCPPGLRSSWSFASLGHFQSVSLDDGNKKAEVECHRLGFSEAPMSATPLPRIPPPTWAPRGQCGYELSPNLEKGLPALAVQNGRFSIYHSTSKISVPEIWQEGVADLKREGDAIKQWAKAQPSTFWYVFAIFISLFVALLVTIIVLSVIILADAETGSTR